MKTTFNGWSRRAFLGRSAGGLGALALAHLMGNPSRGSEAGAGTSTVWSPDPKLPRPRAKAVISLFQHGGPSQMDLFDEKPALNRWNGKPFPGGELEIHFDKQAGNVLGAPYAFKPCGQSGMSLSELLPHTAKIADDITLIRSMMT